MKREQLNRIVGDELDHIPRGPKGSAQNEFRLVYNRRRRVDLGRDPSTPRKESVQRAAQSVTAYNPGFEPEYDTQYFEA